MSGGERPAVWPAGAEELVREQARLARAEAEPWRPADRPPRVAGCFVCFARGGAGPGSAGDPGWAASVVLREREPLARAVVARAAGAPYRPGLLALREGPLLEEAVRALGVQPDVLLVNATGRDHPRRAGLALHLGAVLGIATVGVTHRLLSSAGEWPDDRSGATSPFFLDGDLAGLWLRTCAGTRPLAVHAGWRTDPDCAVEIVLGTLRRARTPEPLRLAREAARKARAAAASYGSL